MKRRTRLAPDHATLLDGLAGEEVMQPDLGREGRGESCGYAWEQDRGRWLTGGEYFEGEHRVRLSRMKHPVDISKRERLGPESGAVVRVARFANRVVGSPPAAFRHCFETLAN